MDPDRLTVTRWRRFGHDRDLALQEPAAALVAHAAAVERADSAHRGDPKNVLAQPSALRRFFAWVLGTDAVAAGRTAAARSSRSWLVGAAGERRVAEVLLSLTRSDPMWQCLHSVPVGTRGSDIDHVLLGPGGIFTINTKHHPRGKVWVGGDVILVNGVARPYVRNSRHEAARAARLLSIACGFPVPVRALLVTVGASLSVKNTPADVTVLEVKALSRWLRRQSVTLSVSTVDHIYAAARRESTWRRPQV